MAYKHWFVSRQKRQLTSILSALVAYSDVCEGKKWAGNVELQLRFEDELQHIETYVALEKLRFNNRINVVYDIQTKNFSVPPLTIQPLVENAVKHGILKKLEGGTVTIRTLEVSEAFIVEIVDDGVGFNMADVDFNSNIHFGMNNIRYRLNTMCRADVVIDSKLGQGTKIRVILYK